MAVENEEYGAWDDREREKYCIYSILNMQLFLKALGSDDIDQ